MKYAPAANLLFIHIPKSAGLTVKDAMSSWSRHLSAEVEADLGGGINSSKNDAFFGYGEHPVIGSIHAGHIPMQLVRQHMPNTYAIWKDARCFAVLRNPKERFLSALAQNLREYKNVGASHVSDQMMRDTAREIVGTIADMGMFADRHYIHFAPQSWFVEDADAPLAVEMFAMDRMDVLGAWLSRQSGEEVSFGASNTTVRPKSKFEAVHKALSGISSILPKGLRERVRPLVLQLPFYRKSSNAEEFQFDEDIEEFIQSYYARDWQLYREAQKRA